MLDDVLSLVLLAILSELSPDDADLTDEGASTGQRNVWTIMRPIVASLATMVVGRVLVSIVPPTYRWTECWSAARRDLAVIVGLLLLTLGLSLAAGYAGSTYLLGGFVAGVVFSEIPRAMELWVQQRVLSDWLTSIFFATLGFAVPVSNLFDAVALGYGLVFTILVSQVTAAA